MEIGAGKAAWHYISGELSRLRSGFGHLTDGGWQGNADGAQRKAGGRARSRAQHEALVVLLDLSLGQRVEIGEDLGSYKYKAHYAYCFSNSGRGPLEVSSRANSDFIPECVKFSVIK